MHGGYLAVSRFSTFQQTHGCSFVSTVLVFKVWSRSVMRPTLDCAFRNVIFCLQRWLPKGNPALRATAGLYWFSVPHWGENPPATGFTTLRKPHHLLEPTRRHPVLAPILVTSLQSHHTGKAARVPFNAQRICALVQLTQISGLAAETQIPK